MKSFIKSKLKIVAMCIVPAVILALPESFYLASAELKWHPYWQAFFVSLIGFSTIYAMLISVYFWYKLIFKRHMRF